MQCIMITGDNPLTAVHVAKDVEIMDRDAMILDLKEGTTTDELVWKNVDETESEFGAWPALLQRGPVVVR